MKTNTIMPTYEQLAVNNAKLSQEVLRLTRTVERLKKKRPVTIEKTVYKNTGWIVCITILLFFCMVIGGFIINEYFVL